LTCWADYGPEHSTAGTSVILFQCQILSYECHLVANSGRHECGQVTALGVWQCSGSLAIRYRGLPFDITEVNVDSPGNRSIISGQAHPAGPRPDLDIGHLTPLVPKAANTNSHGIGPQPCGHIDHNCNNGTALRWISWRKNLVGSGRRAWFPEIDFAMLP